LAALVGCNPNLKDRSIESVGSQNGGQQGLVNTQQFQNPVITVTNLNDEPLEGAQILIGTRAGQPFVNNFLTTDSNGHAVISAEWNSPSSVTVNHPKYMRVTYVNVSPHPLTFKLRPFEKSERIELSGITNGFGSLEKNNIADFGLVIQSLTKRDLFSFSLDKIVSPEMDSMEIAGNEVKIPSNITFPKQRETYIVPITFAKERYRIYFDEPGSKKVYALHGKFPFEQVVDKIRSKAPFTTLVNYFEITSGTMRDIMIGGPTVVNLPVNEINFTVTEQMVPPPIDSDKVMMAISLFENDGYLYPTDLHKVEGNKPFSMKNLAKGNRQFLSLLKRSDDFYLRSPTQEAVSAELVTQSPNHTPTFISLVAPPIGTATSWVNKIPSADLSILPLTTYSVLSKVYHNSKQKVIVREWEVYSEYWTESVELPEWPGTELAHDEFATPYELGGKAAGNRWEVTYIGTNSKMPIPAGILQSPDVVDYTSHISFNSVEF
jgi:hypothetical protein